MNDVGIRLTQVMMERELKDKAIASQLNVSVSLVGQWRRDQARIPSDRLQTLCSLLNLNAHWLLFNVGPKSPIQDWRKLNSDEKEAITLIRTLDREAMKGLGSLLTYGSKSLIAPFEVVDDSSLGERLEEAMEIANLRDKQVAADLEVSDGLVGQWRRNVTRIPSDRLQRICIILNVSCHWLLFGDGPTHPLEDWRELNFEEWLLIAFLRSLNPKARSGLELFLVGLRESSGDEDSVLYLR